MTMAKKEIKKTMMNDYEIDCMWMSYRYCIGRHTISAHCHALNIAKNCYNRLTKLQSAMTSRDIRNEIASYLRMESFHFYDGGTTLTTRTFEHFVEWLNGKSKYDLLQADKITCTTEINGWSYKVEKSEEPRDKTNHFYPQFNDLLVWSNLAALFDVNHHKCCKLIDGSTCEYFEGYIDHTEYNEDYEKEIYHYEKVKIPVEEFAAGRENVYIPNESIAEDNISVE